MVTPALFKRYPDAQALASGDARGARAADPVDRLLPQKSKALIGMAQTLVAEHGGEVPADMER